MEKLLTPLTDARRKGLAGRQHERAASGETGSRDVPKSYRTPHQRDRDRILYSSALQRLAYVTQVTAPESGFTFHNRLSHSLKVAQVGRRNAERLTSLAERKDIAGAAATLVEAVDPDAVEAVCLGHDLGHPPFGHIAEDVLRKEATPLVEDGGFEGNAQSFRIVTRLAVRASGTGLNLTRQTLDGMLKYPWRYWAKDPLEGRKRERKWGYYLDDSEAFAFARSFWPQETRDALPERSLEAELMDWADDLTFAVHDADDFFRAGLVPLDRLAEPNGAELKRFAQLLEDARDDDPDGFPTEPISELVDAASNILGLYGPAEPYEHSISARAAMRDFGSKLITRYLEAFEVSDDPASQRIKLRIDPAARLEVTALKMLVVVYVIRRPGLAVVQHGQRRVIRDLFNWYMDASSPEKGKGDRRLFPPSAKERLATATTPSDRARIVVDLISGLTETAAIQLHHRLAGGWTAPTLDATALMG